jgi:hypothetical protein
MYTAEPGCPTDPSVSEAEAEIKFHVKLVQEGIAEARRGESVTHEQFKSFLQGLTSGTTA